MKPIFAYLKSDSFDKKQIERIRRAGYLPIAVNSLDEFKIVLPVPSHQSNAILSAAMETIQGQTFGADDFGRRICKIFKQ